MKELTIEQIKFNKRKKDKHEPWIICKACKGTGILGYYKSPSLIREVKCNCKKNNTCYI